MYRNAVTSELMPKLRRFQPDMIFLSAGFDGHEDDFYYFLKEEDFEWLTMQMKQIAHEYCQDRIVSVLEGGYNVRATRSTPLKQLPQRKAAKGPSPSRQTATTNSTYGGLPRSCAVHVHALATFT